MLTVDDLLLLVEPFRAKRDISVSRLSMLIFNDGKRLKAMFEKNSDIGSRGLRVAFQWFSDNWPQGAEWPLTCRAPPPPRRPRDAALHPRAV